MLPRKTLTKKQKKEISRKKLAMALIITGLFIVAILLFYSAFIEKDPIYLNPLSKDQTSISSIIKKGLKEKKIEYVTLETSKELNYIIKFDKDSKAIIDPKKDIGEQLSSLQLILSTLKIEGKMFKRLDFRYQKPVISF